MNAAGLEGALRAEGLTVRTLGDWQHTNTGGVWTPAGLMLHHTGPYSSIDSIEQLLRDGRSDLAGPLCQLALRPDGSVTLIAFGKANHAGPGDGAVLDAVMKDRPSQPPGSDTISGNAWFVGVEMIHPGDSTPWPAVQVDAMARIGAALCRLEGWTPNRVTFHRLWTARKVDPAQLDISMIRAAVTARLAPAPHIPEEPDMAAIVRDAAGHALVTDWIYQRPISAADRVTLVNAGKVTDLTPSDALYAIAAALPRAT